MTEASMRNRHCVARTKALCLMSVASASLAVALAAQPVQAQQAAQQPASDIVEIVVTAQKRQEKLQDVPISIAVLKGEELDKQTQGGSLEALALVPGISQSSSDAGGMTQVSIRGVSPAVTFGDGSSTVGYYIDSIPFALVRSAAVPNVNDFDLSRIEVLRGPQGTLYGASALNGVVRMITNDADPFQFDAKVRAGTSITDGGGPSYRTDAEVNIPVVEDVLAVRIVGGDEHQGGWIDQPALGKKNANTTDTQDLRVKVDIRPTEDLQIDLSAWNQHQKQAAASYADASGNQYTTLPEPGSTAIDAYNAKISYDLHFMTLSSATSYLDYRQVQFTDFTYLVPGVRLYSSLPAKALTEEFLLNSEDSELWRWSAGAFYRDAHDDRYQTLPVVLPGPISWRDSSKSTAVFGQVTRTFDDDHFELSGGLRYFHDDAETQTLLVPGGFLPSYDPKAQFHAVTPRFVATWLPSQQLTFYASYSEGFRSGLEQTPLTLLSAPLAPAQADKLHNYELGSKGSLFGGFVTYDASLYYIKWDDVQIAGDVLYKGVYVSATINGPSASGVGTDLALTLHPTPGLAIGADVSENDLTLDQNVLQLGELLYPKGSRLPFSPQYTAGGFVDYALPLTDELDSHFKISANYRSSESLIVQGGGSEVTNGNSYYASGAPIQVNGSVDISNHSNQTVSLYVQNLTNWKGLLIPSPEPVTPYRPRPLTVGIQVSAKF